MRFEIGRDKKRYYRRGVNLCPAHFHASVELLYIVKGEKRVIVNGVEMLLRANEFILCPPYYVHIFPTEQTPCESIAVTLRPEDCPEFCELCKTMMPKDPVVEDTSGEILQLLLALEAPKNRLIDTGIIYTLLGIYATKTRFVKRNAERGASDVEKIAAYVEENYARPLTLGELATHFGYSRTYFSALFKRCFGMGMTEYINSVRVNKSLPLLKTVNASSVYLFVGFRSPQQYFLNFKRQFGCSPGAYFGSKEN